MAETMVDGRPSLLGVLIKARGCIVVDAGGFVQIPEHSPGELEALDDTVLVCVSAPAH